MNVASTWNGRLGHFIVLMGRASFPAFRRVHVKMRALVHPIACSRAAEARHRKRSLEWERHCDKAEQQKTGDTAHGR